MKIRTGMATVIVCGLTFAMTAGCPKSSSQPETSSTSAGVTETPQAGVTEIEDQLRSALYQLQPENLNIDSRLDDAVSVLNNWWAAAQEAKLIPEGMSAATIPTDRVPEELLKSLNSETFDGLDGRHIRACFFAERIADSVTAGVDSDFDRMLQVFEWGCRNLALQSLDQPRFPMTFYEALVVGQMQPEDRAMVLAGIFKQLRIDCVVVRPGKEIVEGQPWLFGVLLDGQVYLFDLSLGLPVPTGDQPPAEQFRKPATLAQLREHPEWLSLLSVSADKPYPMTAQDVARLHVDVITAPRSWSQRMWTIEQLLPGEMLCTLYDPASTEADRPGLFERVAKTVSAATADDVGVWTYPIRQEAWLAAIDDPTARAYQETLLRFIVPVELDVDRETGQTRRLETQRHLRIRTEQLLGHRTDALSQFVTIRQLAFTRPPEPMLIPAYQRAADDAFFWSTVCKYELGEVETAATQLQDYLKRYRRGGMWIYAARSLLADIYRAQGNTEEFRQIASVQEFDDPYQKRHAILAKVALPTTTPE